MNNQTLQSLRQLKLTGMADGFEQQLAQPSTHSELGFDERLALLVDRERTHRMRQNLPGLCAGHSGVPARFIGSLLSFLSIARSTQHCPLRWTLLQTGSAARQNRFAGIGRLGSGEADPGTTQRPVGNHGGSAWDQLDAHHQPGSHQSLAQSHRGRHAG